MKDKQERISKDMVKIINYVRTEHMKRGKTPPSARKITQMMAKRIKKEELLYEEFIRL